MGFNFNFFGKQEVRRFNYKPRFYDPETEERRKKYGDMTAPKQEKYVPGKYVKGSLRNGNYQESHDVASKHRGVGIMTTILLFAVIFCIYKYYPIILNALKGSEETSEQRTDKHDDFDGIIDNTTVYTIID